MARRAGTAALDGLVETTYDAVGDRPICPYDWSAERTDPDPLGEKIRENEGEFAPSTSPHVARFRGHDSYGESRPA